jgi:hypothetical protein
MIINNITLRWDQYLYFFQTKMFLSFFFNMNFKKIKNILKSVYVNKIRMDNHVRLMLLEKTIINWFKF